jgi:hypothetical protein
MKIGVIITYFIEKNARQAYSEHINLANRIESDEKLHDDGDFFEGNIRYE